MGIPYGLHHAHTHVSTFDVKNFSTDTCMASICNPYGKPICVHTIWASYDNAIGDNSKLLELKTLNLVRGFVRECRAGTQVIFPKSGRYCRISEKQSPF